MELFGVCCDVVCVQVEVFGVVMGFVKINIVGGDGQFFDQFICVVFLGQVFDGVVYNLDMVNMLMFGYLSGDKSFIDDIKEVFICFVFDFESFKNLSVLVVLIKVMGQVGEGQQSKIQVLFLQVKKLGLDQFVELEG